MLSFFASAKQHLQSNEGFALTRWGDGEFLLMQNHKFITQDSWKGPGHPTRLGEKIHSVLTTERSKNFYVAIPGKCCSIPLNDWYDKNTKQIGSYRTCANVLINAQYHMFLEFANGLSTYGKKIVMIANHRSVSHGLPFKLQQLIPVEDDCVVMYNKVLQIHEIEGIMKGQEDTIFLLCCGPLANALIGDVWKENKSNYYFDVGSALDEYLFGTKTRPYQNPATHYANLLCEEFK